MKRRSPLLPAAILILVGLFLLLQNIGALDDLNLPGIGKLWPGIIVLAGLAFLLQYIGGGARDDDLVFVGTAATLVGLFFFLFTLEVDLPQLERVGRVGWDDMGRLWPAFPIIAGVAFVLQAILSRGREREALKVGLVAIVVGVVAFYFTLGRPSELEEVVKFWPALLILLGGAMLLQYLFRGRRR